jgi:5-methyltetrahydrofolate--homocysteine methyltransferase
MLIIGELINATRKSVKEIIIQRDASRLQELAKKQVSAGADFLDVNVATGKEATTSEEISAMEWAITTIRAVSDIALSIDSANPEVIKAGLTFCRGQNVFINSVTAEKEKLDSILPLATDSKTKIICLAIGSSGIPKTSEERLNMCSSIYKQAMEFKIAPENIFFDPLVMPVATDPSQGQVTLRTIRYIKKELSECKTTVGLSNVSFGLPDRKLLNRTFLTMLVTAGLDSVITDPLDSELIAVLRASETLIGNDPYCRKYLKMHRAKTPEHKD